LGSLTRSYEAVNGPLTDTLHFHELNLSALCLQGRLPGLVTALGHAKKVSMTFSDATRRVRRPFAVLAAAALVIAAGTLVGLALPPYAISQKGRQFHPGEISIKRGETLQIMNDDGDLLHHAYIDSPKFAFDSGDQQPGSRTDITFPTPGDFEVLCAIHPKMRLVVHVN
jgi:plastocyanin